MSLVLASTSPRRRHLLALGGWAFRVAPAEVDEQPFPDEDAQTYVIRLALNKARKAALQLQGDEIVIAADTAVVDGGQILGKPRDKQEAERVLRRLRGRLHLVYTGVAVLRVSDGAQVTDCCKTDVPMRFYSDEEMLAYIATGDPLDKAGAYAIQHPHFKPVVGLQGCYANVVGLPLCHLTRALDKLGVQPQTNLPQACQAELDYDCPVFLSILSGQG